MLTFSVLTHFINKNKMQLIGDTITNIKIFKTDFIKSQRDQSYSIGHCVNLSCVHRSCMIQYPCSKHASFPSLPTKQVMLVYICPIFIRSELSLPTLILGIG